MDIAAWAVPPRGRRRAHLLVAALCLLALACTPLAAQQLPVDQLTGSQGGNGGTTDPEELRQSLDQVITTLEDAEHREALLADLKELRTAVGEAEDESPPAPGRGLLGALGAAVDELGQPADFGKTIPAMWQERMTAAGNDLSSLADAASYRSAMDLATDAGVFLGLWVVALGAVAFAGRRLSRLRGWPARLPAEPGGWLLGIHFLRHLLPWALAFALLLAALQFLPATPGRTAVVVIAYASLCGRTAAIVCELVISFSNRGHRRPAVAIFRRHGLPRLFLIGVLIGLADALDSDRLGELLGQELASVLSLLGTVIATLLIGHFILRFRRPIQHLIYNRPYHQRQRNSATNEILRGLGRFWHFPALLLVGISLITLVASAGDPGETLTRGALCVALLIVTLVITRLINHHGERLRRRPRRVSAYRVRLERFGYMVAHLALWTVFAEMALQIWGGSLFAMGEATAGARIGQAVLAVAITALLAWLAWILADTAIQHGLASTVEGRGRRVNAARAQTITPMIRNVLFVTILVIAAIVALANLGVNVTPLLAGAGIIGIAVGFGAQTLVQDLITGMFILIEDSLAIDDFVDLGGQMGAVEGLSLRTVRLRDLDGILHIIPFSEIRAIHNMSRQFGVALLRIQVPYTLAVDDAIQMFREVADEVRQDNIIGRHIWGPLELQGVDSFEEGAAVVRLRMRTAPVMQWDVAREFNLRLKQHMERNGVDLARQRITLDMESPVTGSDGAAPRASSAGGEPAPEGN